mmetsp:Transcript_17114/g.43891  ORF Transcript_17114/g.43891 Transcript_17114/m.43891 type:complete len:320 (+) Transcript_17114:549-1508(+)
MAPAASASNRHCAPAIPAPQPATSSSSTARRCPSADSWASCVIPSSPMLHAKRPSLGTLMRCSAATAPLPNALPPRSSSRRSGHASGRLAARAATPASPILFPRSNNRCSPAGSGRGEPSCSVRLLSDRSSSARLDPGGSARASAAASASPSPTLRRPSCRIPSWCLTSGASMDTPPPSGLSLSQRRRSAPGDRSSPDASASHACCPNPHSCKSSSSSCASPSRHSAATPASLIWLRDSTSVRRDEDVLTAWPRGSIPTASSPLCSKSSVRSDTLAATPLDSALSASLPKSESPTQRWVRVVLELSISATTLAVRRSML